MAFAWQAELSPITKLALTVLQSNNQAMQKGSTEKAYFSSNIMSWNIKDSEKQKYSEMGMLQIGANFALIRRDISFHKVFSSSSPGWPSGLGKRLQTAERGFKSSPRLQNHKVVPQQQH